MKTLNEWVLSLPLEKRNLLIEDKWLLANAAFDYAYQSGRDAQRESDVEIASLDASSDDIYEMIKNNTGEL